MAFTEFSRNSHKMVTNEMKASLQDMASRMGISLDFSGGSIGADNLVVKVTVKSSDPEIASVAAKAKFIQSARYYGLTGDDYEAEFVSQGRRFKLVEIAPSRPKYPLTGVDVYTGKKFKFTTSMATQIANDRPARLAKKEIAQATIAAQHDTDALANVAMF